MVFNGGRSGKRHGMEYGSIKIEYRSPPAATTLSERLGSRRRPPAKLSQSTTGEAINEGGDDIRGGELYMAEKQGMANISLPLSCTQH